MGDQPNDLTSLALELHTSGASLNAGETSRYAFKFKTISLIPMDSYFRITVPSEAGFKVSATPACGFITVDGFLAQGTLSCKTEGSRVYITGLGQALPSATSMGLFLEVINPDFAQVSPAWRLEIIRAKTQFLYDWVKELYGPSILPGILTNFNFAPKIATTEISRSKEVLMELKFDLKGEIPEGGVMELIFPSSFTLLDKKFLDIPSTYYITGGLQDKSSNELVTLNFDEITNKLNITSFKKAPAGTTVSMELYLGLPPSTGASQTINLTTYSNSSKTIKIDEDTQNIKVTIPSLSSAISNSASLTSSIASGVGTTDIRFTFQPSVNIPINHKYIISFDSSLTVGNPSSCQRLEPVSSTMETAPCSIAGSSITVNLESATYGLGSGVSINVAGALSVPEVARDYTLDIRIETSAGVLIETYTQQISFTPTVLSGMIFSANPQETNKAAILSLQFTVPFQIPISGTPGLPTDPVSEMRIFFEPRGTTIIDRDVGYGVSSQTSVACRGTQGFLPVLGKYVDCVLFPGLNPFIKLTNYQQLPPGTQVTLELAKFNNPNGDFGVSISVLKLQAGLYQEISKGTSSISLVAAAAATITTAPITQPDLAYTIDNRKVSSQFKIVFELALVNGVNLGEFLIVKLPSYDTGFVQDPNSVVCKINNDVKQCTAFNRADWFKIKLDAALAVGAGIENFLQLENLKWPRYSQENGQVQIDVISATFATLHTYKYANLIQVESNLLEKFTLDLDKLKKKQTNALYTFNFQTKQGIPDGGMIVLEMPSQYTLLASEPKVEILFPDFTNSTSKPLNSYFSSSKVTIENIGAYPPLIDFKVILKGVRNPNTDIVLHDWKLSILLNNFLVDQQDKFLAFSLDPTYIPRTITVNRITAFPDNSDVYADYYFSFTPRSSLGAGADLSIEFPSQYKILPSTPICVVSGALNTFADCVTDLNAIRIVTDTPFLEGTINVRIDNIRNPVSGLTDTFEIQSRYDSELVDQVDPTVSSGKIIQVKAIPPAIYVKSFNFDPQNEGEVSTYTFQFTPPTTLTRTQEIILKFPASFDKNIGRRVRCYPKKNLNGNVLCRFEEKKIIIYNFDPVNVTKDDPIEMEIQGVVNPNRIVNGDAGYVSIGILEAGTTTYLSYVAKAGVIEPKPAAGWTFFHGIDLTNTLARSTSDYIFNLTVFDPIPAVNAGGLVVIELPIEFDLQDQTIPCSAPDSTFGNTTCSIQSNRIFVSGNKQPFNGNFQIKIEKMRNPFEQVETDYFYIKTYDGFRKKIIERSFYTLDPFFRTYTFPGPVIRINGDIPITVEAGTQTVDLYATVDQLSNLNLVLKPTAPPGISFIPFEIPLGIGENKASFRISVTESFEEGDVLVEWSILKDLIPPYFTSIKPFKITITKNRSIPIIISQLNNIPFGGQSLPCMIYIQNAPDTGVEISLRKKFPYKGINLDKDVVYFDSGINRGYFTLSYTDAAAAAEENISSGQIEIALGGLNSKLYTLNEITLTFNIDPEDNTAPKVESLTTISLSQHSCKVRVTTNDVAEVYYMIALRGTAQPPLFEVRNQGPPPYLSTSSRYGKSSIGSSLIAEVTFPNLSAETEYIIYAYAEDRGGNVNGNPGFLIIRTSSKLFTPITTTTIINDTNHPRQIQSC